MSDALSRLPGRAVETALRTMAVVAQEIKAPQRKSGLSGIRGYPVVSANTWDASGSMGASGIGASYKFLVTLTGNGDQEWPVAVPSVDVFLNGTAESNRVPADVLAGGRILLVDANTTIDFDNFGTIDPEALDTENVLRWIISGWIYGSLTYYLKARINSSCPGTVTITRVA